ncbi:unnamed protein product [Vicia faba]|uniref:Trimethylguanosine synthase n=1 Tax=Vicia faba TaxID=3906 RepID=A0AAV1A792_VICFA|nr:unnamed protein product [Vicia faba]
MAITDSDYDGAAIQSLGSLFSVTQVFLWDDGFQVPPSSEDHHSIHESNPIPERSNVIIVPEDLELNKQMNELGLPLSFETNKKCGPVKSKKKRVRSKHPRTCNDPVDEDLNEVNTEEVISPAKFHDKNNSSVSCISMLGQSETSYCDGAVEVDMAQCVSGEGDNASCCAGFANGISREGNNSIKVAENNDVHNSDLDLKIACALDTGVSAGSHLTDCETVFNDDAAATRQSQANESEPLPMSLEENGCDRIDGSNDCGELGDWMVLWDTFYKQRYFYNVKTDISTWDPPPGMEHLVYGGCTELDDREALKSAEECETQNSINPPEETLVEENLSGMQHEDCSAEIGVAAGNLVSGIANNNEDQCLHHSDENLERSSCNDGVSCCSISNTLDYVISSNDRCSQATSEVDHTPMENMVIDTPGLDSKSDPFMSKQKKKVKRKPRRKKFDSETEDLQLQKMPEAYSEIIAKYWCQRYILFTRFDDGVKMDEEGWFSVTPEVIAHYQASRCAGGTVIDCFTGVGGNAIQFAQRCRNVIAIDIDPLKIDYARHNASIYRVDDQIDFIVGDFFLLAPKLKADTVFLSPPWGGPDYAKVSTYDMKTMLRPRDGYTLFNAAKEIASRIVMFLPKNVDFNQLAELSLSASPPWSLEVEKVHLNGKLKAVTAYFCRTPVGGC